MVRFGDALATGADLVSAAERAVRQALDPLDGPADLVCVFVCGADPEEVALAGERAMALAEGATTIGCSSTGVIGGGRAVEGQGSVSVWAAVLPNVTLTPFRLDSIPEGDHLAVVGMTEPEPTDRAALLLANPYDFPAHSFVRRSTAVLGELPIVGGLADGMHGRESVRLFFQGETLEGGAIGLLLGGDGVVGTAVSQGCRPIGPAMAVTKAEGNNVLELAGTPAYAKLEDIVNALPAEEQDLLTQGLHIGVAMDEYADRHERGDFLVRGVVGAAPEEGTLTVAEVVEVGQTVRFQVRDNDTADTDLVERLRAFGEDTGGCTAAALLFSCNGRGASMFSSADHDVRCVRQTLGIDAVTGFFAAGEIGPVAGRNHLHGFTACLLAFRE
ncbi:small ligand-binding sensory domain FIST [Spinactinospora alkalitolerans]|uniref:Small ligand-binding sensory domain FIST n=1 Tax=Spinactinospora alkalitolerans TaxID=687207 RepID=A0A852TTZ4_9ACTN|nr:FIST N-terminal domain-containing protein [Spinactinospora alkalitolerans]NYE45594.1 small ligand-binding sensory domain FIST [Spinactinospora alkalitolerans]